MSLKADRAADTRALLISVARRLFGERGYAGVGTEEIVQRAGLTRGALYHHFGGKKDLFRAVFEQVESDLTKRIADQALAAAPSGPLEAMRLGTRMFLEAAQVPEVQRIVMLDAPSVLGWESWREVVEAEGMGLVQALVTEAIAQGEIDPAPIKPLVHILTGAIDEAAMYVARSPEPEQALSDALATLDRLLEGLRPR